MASCDTEFDFDCPRFAYELSALNSISDSEISYIDPWFLRYHADHDREVQPSAEVEKERSSYGRASTSGAAKSTTSHLGPVRISRHQSGTAISAAHCSFPSGRRGSQKGDESKVNDMKNQVIGKVTRLSSGTKRKINSDQSIESIETTTETPATDMRDKLDEFRQRKKRDNASDHNCAPPIVKSAIPPTDYSRSKIVLSAPSTAPVTGGDISTIKSQIAHAKKLSASVHSTSSRVESKRTIPAVSKTVVASSRSLPQKHATQNVTNSTTNSSGSSSSSSSKNLSNRKSDSAQSGAVDDNASMMELLKKHNQRFAPIPIYEPPRHSVRDVRQWEKSSGKTWLSLKPEEREVVNAEISKTKEAAKKEAGR